MLEFLHLYKFTLSLFSRIFFLASLSAVNETFIDKFIHSSEDTSRISDIFFSFFFYFRSVSIIDYVGL
jgi:hypothetical protein